MNSHWSNIGSNEEKLNMPSGLSLHDILASKIRLHKFSFLGHRA